MNFSMCSIKTQHCIKVGHLMCGCTISAEKQHVALNREQSVVLLNRPDSSLLKKAHLKKM